MSTLDNKNIEVDENDDWVNALVQGSKKVSLPLKKGKYDAVITDAYHETRGEAGYDMVHVDFEVVSGDSSGCSESKEYHVTTQKASDYLKNEFGRIGIDIAGRYEIAPACGKAIGKQVQIKVDFLPNGSKAVYITGERKQKPQKFDPNSFWK
jgi:hypothetical protein